MMQEQEIVRLEMRLKEETLERATLAQQLDLQRRSSNDHDKVRLKLQGEIYMLKERCTQLEESGAYYKNQSDGNYRTCRESEKTIHDLQEQLESLRKVKDATVKELSDVMTKMKIVDGEKCKLEDLSNQNMKMVEELRIKIESEQQR